MLITLLKATGIWLVLVLMAMINGLIREKVITPIIGPQISLPVSGVILSILIFMISYFLIPLIREKNRQVFIYIGLYWVALTLSFEYLLGYFIMGKSWTEINQVFAITHGNLFIIVLLISAVSPWLVAKIKGIGQ